MMLNKTECNEYMYLVFKGSTCTGEGSSQTEDERNVTKLVDAFSQVCMVVIAVEHNVHCISSTAISKCPCCHYNVHLLSADIQESLIHSVQWIN